MQVKTSKENPENAGYYFVINPKGFIGLMRFDGKEWFLITPKNGEVNERLFDVNRQYFDTFLWIDQTLDFSVEYDHKPFGNMTLK